MLVMDVKPLPRIAGPTMAIVVLLAGCGRREDVETAEATPSSPEHRFALTFPDHFFTCPPTPAHIRWKDSLVRNIHHQGNAHVFMLTDLVVLDHGATRTGIVYQNTGNPDQFMVTPEQYRKVVIDRKKSVVGTMGCRPAALFRRRGILDMGLRVEGVAASSEAWGWSPPPSDKELSPRDGPGASLFQTSRHGGTE